MEDRPTEIQGPPGYPPEPPPGPGEPPPGPPGVPPPWYREYWWIWLIVLLLVVGGIIAFFALRDSGNNDNAGTQTSGPAKVPNVVGMQEQAARSTLEQAGFQVEVVRQPADQDKGLVVEQAPQGGSKLAQGSTVRIAVSTGPPPTQTVTETQTVTSGPSGESGPQKVEMPDVAGSDYPDAVDQVLNAGLFPASFPVDSTEDRGTVVDQRPAAGTQAPAGSGVRIDVSLGTGERAERQVPDLTGQPLDDALRACAQAGFTCRAVPASAPGHNVTGQRPVSGGSTELSQIELSTG